MATIKQLRDFLLQCPLLVNFDDNKPLIFVDYLTDRPAAYSIMVIPVTPWVRKYVDGDHGVKQMVFSFRSREIYAGREIIENMDNIAFYELFEEWLRDTKPTIPGWIKVEPLSNGYIYDVEEGQDLATYQIQCRVLYTV